MLDRSCDQNLRSRLKLGKKFNHENRIHIRRASTPLAGIVDIGTSKQLFIDDLLVDEASRISRYQYRPPKYADNPVMVADRPHEQGKHGGKNEGGDIVGQTVLYNEEEEIFKMWYVPWALGKNRRPWCYATSKDGYNWDKPNLGFIGFEGSTRNNYDRHARRSQLL